LKLRIQVLSIALLLQCATSLWADEEQSPVHIVGVMEPRQIEYLLEQIEARFPLVNATYKQMREGQIISNIMSSAGSVPSIDIAIISDPGVGVRLANEGFLTPFPVSTNSMDGSHWRGEVLALFYDSPVMVVRKGVFSPEELPRGRLKLAHFLEKNKLRLSKRLGLINIGVDSQSYAYSTQDLLRTPLFWRISRAFGRLDSRIYENSGEVLEALQLGEIDIAYNIPLSQLALGSQEGLTVFVPEDYAVSVPWVLVAPEHSRQVILQDIVGLLQELVEQQKFPNSAFWNLWSELSLADSQRVNIGPELLVFLDPIKKTNILDSWFQMVTNQ
jgi:ABC-type Fe3+ transport system substrate-binding protein